MKSRNAKTQRAGELARIARRKRNTARGDSGGGRGAQVRIAGMTEAERLTCADPTPMHVFVRRKASRRKVRLFACACAYRVSHLLTDQRSRKAIEVAERHAD